MGGWLVQVAAGGPSGTVGYYAVWKTDSANAARRLRDVLHLIDGSSIGMVRRLTDEELLAAGAQPGRVARVGNPDD